MGCASARVILRARRTYRSCPPPRPRMDLTPEARGLGGALAPKFDISGPGRATQSALMFSLHGLPRLSVHLSSLWNMQTLPWHGINLWTSTKTVAPPVAAGRWCCYFCRIFCCSCYCCVMWRWRVLRKLSRGRKCFLLVPKLFMW